MDFDNGGMDIEDKEVASQVFDTVCSTLAETGNTSEIDTVDKLLQLWVKVANVVAHTGDDDTGDDLEMFKRPSN